VDVRTETADFAFDLSDTDGYVRVDSSSGVTAQLRADHHSNFPLGASIAVEQAGAGAVTIQAGPGVTINKPETLITAKQFAVVTLTKIAASTWTLAGYTTSA